MNSTESGLIRLVQGSRAHIPTHCKASSRLAKWVSTDLVKPEGTAKKGGQLMSYLICSSTCHPCPYGTKVTGFLLSQMVPVGNKRA